MAKRKKKEVKICLPKLSFFFFIEEETQNSRITTQLIAIFLVENQIMKPHSSQIVDFGHARRERL